MNKPPDNTTILIPHTPYLEWDPTKTLNLTTIDPVYLVMTRINTTETLKNISPFLLQKAIDATCGEVLMCKKILSGQILVKTKSGKQANKLSTLIGLSSNIKIHITIHPSLNFSKGVIYCNDLRNIPEKEILQELAPQNVHEVKKIYKKKDNQLLETGLIIITFTTTLLPTKINVGYLKVPIRPYIPPPMRCKNCWKYNHLAKFCKNTKICPNCANNYHLNDEIKEECKEAKKCVNCTNYNNYDPNHSAFDKKCPIFIKEKEIQLIKTTSNVDNKTAKTIYKQRHPSNNTTYATTVNNPMHTTTHTSNETTDQSKTHLEKPTQDKATTSNRATIQHDLTTSSSPTPTTTKETTQAPEMMSESDSDSETTNVPKQNLKIFPKNISKRLRKQLKKSNTNKTKNLNKIQVDALDTNLLDIC
uniref:Nucleic-acid-binding protein from transposon X-element n=2 Tax=Ceratitis capitata TaxID=7213 RepID=W8BG04_CERCA